MNALEILNQLIEEYNAEKILSADCRVNKDIAGENRYNHGAYKLAPFVKQMAFSLDLEIERFEKDVVFIDNNYDEVKQTVFQIRIKY